VKKGFTVIVTLVLIMMVALSAGCAGGAAKTIKIGLIAPMTGDVKTFGESTKKGFLLALDEIGTKSGDKTTYKVGDWKIQFVIADDRNDATETTNVATKLATQDKVQVIVGSVASKCTIAASAVAEANKVVLITPTSTNPKVTVADGKRKTFVFRACFIDPFQGTVGAKFALGTLKAKTAAVMLDKGNDYVVGLAEYFKAAFEKGGGKIVAWEAYSQTDADFSAVLTKIAKEKPDVLYLPDYYNKVSLIGKQARAKGITAPFVGGDGWDSSDLDTKTMDGGFFTNHYSPEDKRSEVAAFVSKFKAKHGEAPDALATLAYDSAKIVLEAIRVANSKDTTKIRDAMQGIKDFTTVSGKVTFDKDGNPVKSAVILQIKDGKQKYVETVNP
jgi:branched-chain amino acid transport system substrate-binding protein